MDRRRLLLILAVFVALIGTALVFLYVKSASKVPETTVYVAATNINANETWGSAVSSAKVVAKSVPQSYADSVPGAVTDTTAIKDDEVATAALYQGQLIVASQFSTNAQAAPPPPSTLAIPKGDIAISVNLTDPDRVAGNIENGSHVAIFVTGDLTPVGGAASTSSTSGSPVTTTRLLLPDVTVLNVGSPQPPSTSTKTDANGTQTTEQLPRTLLTIAVTQKEAQQVIVSSKALNLTFGLLTNDSSVHPGPGTSTLVASLFR
jgi:pilus assembly protein CpaB